MLLPLHDRNPLKVIPFQAVTIGLIAVCVVIFLWQQTLTDRDLQRAFIAYGMIPSTVLGPLSRPPEVYVVPAALTLLTSMFLHGDWMHLIGNMLFLWVFGDNLEDAMGHVRFLVFYLLCGVAAGLAQGAVEVASNSPMIGASGAVAGVLGGYLMLHPKVKVLCLILMRLPLFIPAYLALGFWIALQVYNVMTDAGGNTAWWAHIGGFVAGAILIVPFRRKDIPLFDKGTPH